MDIIIGDVTRVYKEAKGVNVAEVAKGNATAMRSLPPASTTYPGTIVSTLMQKTKGGSGTYAGQVRINDERSVVNGEAIVPTVTNVAIDIMQRPASDSDVEYAGALLMAVATKYTENNCALLKELFNNIHQE